MKAVRFIRKSLLTGVCVGLLTGCAWLESWPGATDSRADNKKAASPAAEVKTAQTQTQENQWLPPGSDGTELLQVQGAKGIAIDPASMDRITRLEKAVEQMSNDIKLMMPALARMAEAQGDLQKSLTMIEPAAGINMGQAGQQPAPLTPVLAKTQPASYEQKQEARKPEVPVSIEIPAPVQQNNQTAALATQTGNGGAFVTNVRFGEHADKTRLMLDTSNKVAFSYDLDNNENILMVSLPNTGWTGLQQMNVGNSPVVSSYHVVPDNAGGQQLVIQLKHAVRVLWAQALTPGGPQGHRIVFDLAAI
ncbi:MAG: hypothetical protein CO093_06450 [Alphaproteobacteria bacterium CG_4_9_14_3_um_filter_47_13]|nr:MAG: hypothetical protein CO093_06450 [Alphaproteobacteria bacterium CG_4_9_14_3_um_filter_47_13]